VRFKVIYVMNGARVSESKSVVTSLRAKGVPVATITEGAVGYAMGKVDLVIVGAEGVVENGGIISRLGTYQIGLLAKAAGRPFYVVAESHKFVRLYPLGQYDLPIEQKVIEFKTADEEMVMKTEERADYFGEKTPVDLLVPDSAVDAVDYTVGPFSFLSDFADSCSHHTSSPR
jgi:translation initiation factor eIF-2B subunit alpha